MFELLENVNALGTNTDVLTPEEDAFMENYSTGWECNYDDPIEALLYTLIENEQNFNAIMQATMVQEANYFIENGTTMVYEAVDFKVFFGKIKEAVMKAWEKIKAIYLKVMDTINSWAATDKLFIKKYGEVMKKASGKISVIYTGYKMKPYNKDILKNFVNAAVDHCESYKDKIGSDEYDTSDFMKAIYKAASSSAADTKEKYIAYIKEQLGIDKKHKLKL